MTGSAIEAASTSSECLSSEDSEPPPAIGRSTYHQLPQDWPRTISEAFYRRPRNMRLPSKADVQPHPGDLFCGAVSQTKVIKRTNQLSRQRELAFKRQASRSPVKVVDADLKSSHGNPRRTPSRTRSTKASAGSSTQTPLRTPKTSMPASLKTAHSTPDNFSPAWSQHPSESLSSDGDDSSTTGAPGPNWELTDPVARGLRQEIQRVRREKQAMLNKVRDIDLQLEQLSKSIE